MSWWYGYADRILGDKDLLTGAEPGGLSRRVYNLLIGGIATASLVIIGLMCVCIYATPEALSFMYTNIPFFGVVVIVGVLVGLLTLLAGGANTGNVIVSVIGYGILLPLMGLSVACNGIEECRSLYSATGVLGTIGVAIATTITFAILGFIRPSVFRQPAVTLWSLAIALIIELTMILLFDVHHTWADRSAIAIFCVFAGWNLHVANNDTPTTPGAFWYSFISVVIFCAFC